MKMSFSKYLSLVFLSLIPFLVQSQDIDYARYIIDTLSSVSFDGRGYVNQGDKKAAIFISEEFGKLGLKKFDASYFQSYSFPMNTLPGRLEVRLGKRLLVPGSEYQVWAASPEISGRFRIKTLSPDSFLDAKRIAKIRNHEYGDNFLLIDKRGITDKKLLHQMDSLRYTNYLQARGLIFITEQKLSWSVMIGNRCLPYPVVDIHKDAFVGKPGKIQIDVESRFFQNYETQNVIGYIEGAVEPDTMLVFTAHYDHLGRMGKDVYYPGANDNGSGTAMVLDLARHYSRAENKPYYTMVFILLSGEEAGLHGSEYCADHPPFTLQKIKFLMNIDMVGTGSEGITVVNGSKYKEAYNKMVQINADNEYIMTVKERGESCNSDHCPFYRKGVPSVFIYSMGKEFSEYHNIDDQSKKLPLTEYKDIFLLVRDFMDGIRKW
jgi:hypothetical protein